MPAYYRLHGEPQRDRILSGLERLRGQLDAEVPAKTLDNTALVHLPYYTGVLNADGRQRVAAVAGDTGALSEAVSHVLTANLPQLRTHFTI